MSRQRGRRQRRRGRKRSWKDCVAMIVTGDTVLHVAELRNMGFRWDSVEKRWWRPTCDCEEDTRARVLSLPGLMVDEGLMV